MCLSNILFSQLSVPNPPLFSMCLSCIHTHTHTHTQRSEVMKVLLKDLPHTNKPKSWWDNEDGFTPLHWAALGGVGGSGVGGDTCRNVWRWGGRGHM